MSGEAPLAIVTGASRGIGRAVASGLAREGYRLALIARDAAALEQLSAELVHAGAPETAVLALDLADDSIVREAIGKLLAAHGRADILFNNAAIVRRGTELLASEDLDAMWQTNSVAIQRLVSLVAPVMKRRASGHIINMASRSARYPKAGNGGYAATKAALIAYGGALYQELAPFGVKVTTILPSYTDTDQSKGQTWLAAEQRIRPMDIFEALRFLTALSPSASVPELLLECTHVVAHGEQYV